ncbi:MAG: tRNA preQ1(34) S-adenosylmethionine ribosyltransferase-isomerase QueA [Tissierellia bacterium]|nr:tRNA preQ1(34) S-adenosylmethionine ribosyltransferase-isomerase QueA [Tissierellia bacterium]
MKKSDFYFELPEELIAQHPNERRDGSRLLHLKRQTGAWEDLHFYDLLDLIQPEDVLVINNTKVLPARLFGHREGREESIEVLLLKEGAPKVWDCLVRPGKKLKLGVRVIFSRELSGTVVDILEDGVRQIRLDYEGSLYPILDELGTMPLPPYIKERLEDQSRYQTVYAKDMGSAAAPTAGLHFTPELLEKIRQKGVAIAQLTLHVGLGTFRPVQEEEIEDHLMHREFYQLDEQTAQLINERKAAGGRVIAVGTTSIRTLESIARKAGSIVADADWTDIFIYPGYEFKAVDAIVTNFHLPESTLIMLIAAFTGREEILNAYGHAIEEKYRFFSFGDAMFID